MCGQAASDNMQTSEIICKWMQGDTVRERERRSGTGQNRGEGLTLCRCLSQGEKRQNRTRPENINTLAQQFIEGVKFDMHT